MKDTSYHDFVVYDLMARLPDISSRRMMGGWCIYSTGMPFAAIIENQLYLKAKGELAEDLKRRGWKQFSYDRQGKTVYMSYWLVPADIIDDQVRFDEVMNDVL